MKTFEVAIIIQGTDKLTVDAVKLSFRELLSKGRFLDARLGWDKLYLEITQSNGDVR